MLVSLHGGVSNDHPQLVTFDGELTNIYTVMILSFRTDRSGQTVQTQIRLLLEKQSDQGQSDQGLHCLLFHSHFLDGLGFLFEF